MTTRDRRRAETKRVCANRRRQLRQLQEPERISVNAGYFKSVAALGCNCRKTRKGRPRVASGMCKIDMRMQVYKSRQTARELRHQARAGRSFDE